MLSSLHAHVNIFGNINEEKLSHYKVTQVNFWFSLAKLDYALSKGVICYTYIIMTLWSTWLSGKYGIQMVAGSSHTVVT